MHILRVAVASIKAWDRLARTSMKSNSSMPTPSGGSCSTSTERPKPSPSDRYKTSNGQEIRLGDGGAKSKAD